MEEDLLCNVSNINYLVGKAIQKYKNHPSIQVIQESLDSNKKNLFELFSSGIILKKIESLDIEKAARSNDVPTNIVKENADLFSIFVSNDFNESAISCIFL